MNATSLAGRKSDMFIGAAGGATSTNENSTSTSLKWDSPSASVYISEYFIADQAPMCLLLQNSGREHKALSRKDKPTAFTAENARKSTIRQRARSVCDRSHTCHDLQTQRFIRLERQIPSRWFLVAQALPVSRLAIAGDDDHD